MLVNLAIAFAAVPAAQGTNNQVPEQCRDVFTQAQQRYERAQESCEAVKVQFVYEKEVTAATQEFQEVTHQAGVATDLVDKITKDRVTLKDLETKHGAALDQLRNCATRGAAARATLAQGSGANAQQRAEAQAVLDSMAIECSEADSEVRTTGITIAVVEERIEERLRETLEAAITTEESLVSFVEEEIRTLRQHVDESRATLTEEQVQSLVQSTDAEITALEAIKAASGQIIANTRTEVTTSGELSSTITTTATAAAQLEAITRIVVDVSTPEVITKTEDRIVKVCGQLNESAGQITTAVQKDGEAYVATVEARVTKGQKVVAQLRKRLEAQETQLTEANTDEEKQTIQKAIDALKDRVTAAQEAVKSTQETLSTAQSTYQTATTQVEQQVTEIANTTTTIQSTVQVLVNITQQIQVLTNKTERTDQEDSQLARLIVQLGHARETVTRSTSTVTSVISETQTTVQNLETETAVAVTGELNQEVTNARVEVEFVTEQATQHQTTVEETQRETQAENVVIKAGAEFDETVEKIKEQISKLPKDDLVNLYVEEKKKVTISEKVVDYKKTVITQLEQKATGVATELTEQQSSNAGLQEQLAKTKTEVTVLINKLDTQKQQCERQMRILRDLIGECKSDVQACTGRAAHCVASKPAAQR